MLNLLHSQYKKFKEEVEDVVVLDSSPGPEQTSTTVVDPPPTLDQKHHPN